MSNDRRIKDETLYLDTSLPSAYYDKRVMWRLEYTRQWWKEELIKYKVFVSEAVIAEIKRTKQARKRDNMLNLVTKFTILDISPQVEKIAKGYVSQGIVPYDYFPDGLHIAVASFYKIDFLATWNCEHLAEAHRRKRIRLFNASAGLFAPEIVTPMELIEGGKEDA